MNARAFLLGLQAKGIRVWVEGDSLKFKSEAVVLPPGDLDMLRTCKAELMALLSVTRGGSTGPPEPVATLRSSLLPLVAKLERADLWFATNGPEHPHWLEAGRRIDRMVAELREVLDHLWEQGYVWTGAEVAQRPVNQEVAYADL